MEIFTISLLAKDNCSEKKFAIPPPFRIFAK